MRCFRRESLLVPLLFVLGDSAARARPVSRVPLGARVLADEMSGLWCSVAPAGDVDGDGVPDLALAGRTNGPLGFGGSVGPGLTLVSDLGRVWILSGRDGLPLAALEPPVECPDFGLALAGVVGADGEGAVAIAGGGRAWIYSGRGARPTVELAAELEGIELAPPIAAGPDIDGDGHPDLALHARVPRGGAGGGTADRRGAALVCSGRTGKVLAAHGCGSERPSWVPEGLWHGVEAKALTGPLALLADRGGEGHGELALGVGGVSIEGVDGKVEGLEVRTATGGEVLLRAPLPSAQYPPWLLAPLGDVDGDGLAELLYSRVNEHVLVLSGASGEILRRHDYAGGYLNGEGTSLQSLPDLDGDGLRDYLIAANEDGWDCDAGFLAVHSGGGAGTIHHYRPEEQVHRGACGVGVDAAVIGDVDGDGKVDIAVHLPRLRELRVLSGSDLAVLWRADIAGLRGAQPR